MPEPVETPKPPDPPKDDKFAALESRLSELQGSIGTLQAVMTKAEPPPPPPSANYEPTEDEISQSIANGQLSPVLKRWGSSIRESVKRELLDTHVKPLQDRGEEAISQLSSQAARTNMPFYSRFAKEIDGYVAQMPREARMNPQAYIIAHNAVVGSHANELISEAKAAGGAGQAPGSSTGRDRPTEPSVPTVSEALGPDAASALQERGVSPDQFYQSLGYKGGWTEFYNKRVKTT